MLHCSAARGKKAALVPKEGRLVCECYTVWCTSAGRFFDACVSFFSLTYTCLVLGRESASYWFWSGEWLPGLDSVSCSIS